MNFRGIFLASAMLALPLSAAKAQGSGQPVNGAYVAGSAGINWLWDEHFTGSLVTPNGTTKYSATGSVGSSVGPALVASVGWGFGNGLRAEIEGNIRWNNAFSNPSGFSVPGAVGGNEMKFGGMVNVLYDFYGLVPWIQPYVGVGIGGLSTQLNNFAVYTTNYTPVFKQPGSQGAASFAYQFILGAAVPIDRVPGLAVTGEFRFLGLAGNRSYPGFYGPETLGRSYPGSVTSSQNFNSTFLIGLRYAFGVAPAPLPPPPPVEGPKTFLVFFDWDKYDLTPQGAAIVADAAQYATTAKYTRIDVDGNTDTTGSAGYNMGLSERRARTVAAALVAKGVPQSAITIRAFGDTRLLVPTGPDVREPQNRRVEIVFH